jgi:hypothetical protein
MGSLVMGGLARRGATNAVRRLMGVVGSRAASPTVAGRQARTSGEPQAQRATSVRVFRQAPELGANRRTIGARQTGARGAMFPERRSMEPTGISSGGPGGGGPQDTRLGRLKDQINGAGGKAPGVAVSAAPATSPGGRRKISAGTAAAPSARSTAASSGMHSGAGGTGSSGAEARPARHAKSARSDSRPAAHSRFEPRLHTHSASLRDGPPKVVRNRRKPVSGSTRRFREYSDVTKNGVTVMVPPRR